MLFKGILYAKIQIKNESHVHLFTTHMAPGEFKEKNNFEHVLDGFECRKE